MWLRPNLTNYKYSSHSLICSFVAQAVDGTYIDKKCPFTGNVRIRGRILTGIVQKLKMQRTIVIRRDYLHYVRKYSRFEKRHKNMSVHLSPAFRFVLFAITKYVCPRRRVEMRAQWMWDNCEHYSYTWCFFNHDSLQNT